MTEVSHKFEVNRSFGKPVAAPLSMVRPRYVSRAKDGASSAIIFNVTSQFTFFPSQKIAMTLIDENKIEEIRVCLTNSRNWFLSSIFKLNFTDLKRDIRCCCIYLHLHLFSELKMRFEFLQRDRKGQICIVKKLQLNRMYPQPRVKLYFDKCLEM